MDNELRVKHVIDHLQQHKASLCCEDIKRLLISLGFEVRDGKQGGHKVFVHHGLLSFHSGSFNCGHSKNHEIKPAYISKIVQILKHYQDDLEKL